MASLFLIRSVSLVVLFLVSGIVASQTSDNQSKTIELATIPWGVASGLPYSTSSDGSFGIRSFEVEDNQNIVFLSAVERKIINYATDKAEVMQAISLDFFPINFTMDENRFYVAGQNDVYVIEKSSELSMSFPYRKYLKSIEKMKIAGHFLYLIGPDDISFRFDSEHLKKAPKRFQGQFVGGNYFVRSVRVNDFEYSVEIFSGKKWVSTTQFQTTKKIGCIEVVGKVKNMVILDLEFIVNEVPVEVERTVSFFSLSNRKAGEVWGSILIPNVYYIFTKQDLYIADNRIFYLCTSSSGATVFDLPIPSGKSARQVIRQCFPKGLYDHPYHYNSDLPDNSRLEEIIGGEQMDGNKSIQANIYRSQMVAIAETFDQHNWYCNSYNIQDVDCGSGHVTTPGWVVVGNNVSFPYMWGGFSSLSQFDSGLLGGKCAGDQNTDTYAGTSCAEGVDCSGFISRAWELTSKYGTSTLPNISTAYSSFTELKPGDVVNYSGSHVRMVHTLNPNGTFLMIESSASATNWSVGYNTYSVSDLQVNYVPRFYNMVQEDQVYPPTLLTPLHTQSGISMPVPMDWTDIANAGNYRLQVALSSSGWTAADGFTSSLDSSSTIPVNINCGNVSHFNWTGSSNSFGTPTPNTTYYWTVRVYVPTLGTSMYTQPRSYTTAGDMVLPTTSFTVDNWNIGDFSVGFTDEDDFLVKHSLYNVSDFNGTEWRSNGNSGFFSDYFSNGIHPDWNLISGSWSVDQQSLKQTDEVSSNTNAYATVVQESGNTYLYHWKMKISGTGSNRRGGIYFFCDDASQTQRNNAYMVYLRADNNTCQIYKSEGNSITLKTDDPTIVDVNTWYDCKVLFNQPTGEIFVFQDNVLVSSWVDTSPHTDGNAISLRTGNCIMYYDDFRVYKSRGNEELIAVGANEELRYQNTNPSTPAGNITALCVDYGNNFSPFTSHTINVDWTSPEPVSNVLDGFTTDQDTTVQDELVATWTQAVDDQSGISEYFYAVGTTSGDSNIIGWTSCFSDTGFYVSTPGLIEDSMYYVSIRAENAAGLISGIATSDGIYYSQSTDIQNVVESLFLRYYPNPVNDVLEFDLSGFDGNTTTVLLYDEQGRLIFSMQSISFEGVRQKIDVTDFPSGYYFIRVSDGQKTMDGRVVIQR